LYRRFKTALRDSFIGIVVESKGFESDISYFNDGVLELNADRFEDLTAEYLNLLEVPTQKELKDPRSL
jgi:hypothetical protein